MARADRQLWSDRDADWDAIDRLAKVVDGHPAVDVRCELWVGVSQDALG
jgi:hypothetical protein